MTDCTGGSRANTEGQEGTPKMGPGMTDCTGGSRASTEGQEDMPKMGTA